MADFLLTQIRLGQNVYLYPDGDLTNCTDWTPVGDAPNWKCVDDDRFAPDDDTTYVYNLTDSKIDLYTLPNLSLTGTINYVQVFSRAKSHQYAQARTGVYYIIVSPNGICTDYYESDDKDLVTTYKNYNHVWNTSPKTSLAWTWAEINTLCIGQRATSPSYSTSKTLTLRPNAAGTFSQCGKSGCTLNYQCVDDVTPDDDATYVIDNVVGDPDDTYNIPNHTTEHGTITSISHFLRMTGGGAQFQYTIRIGGILYHNSTWDTTEANWVLYSYDWTTNPNSGIAWTWTDVDNLEIGLHLRQLAKCTQCYTVVNYLEPLSPQIRCTQSYCKVNYDTSETCSIDKPEEWSTNHKENIKMLNFWSGEREVYTLNVSGRSLVMKGIFYDFGACTDIQCVRDMGLNGNIVTVSGLNPALLNNDYYIRSFGWEQVSKQPEVFRWMLDLERSSA